MPDTTQRTMTIPEVAEALGISRGLCYELARTGQLPGILRLGERRIVVSRRAVEEMLAPRATVASATGSAL
jgi:excisionase family DNA binding protein